MPQIRNAAGWPTSSVLHVSCIGRSEFWLDDHKSIVNINLGEVQSSTSSSSSPYHHHHHHQHHHQFYSSSPLYLLFHLFLFSHLSPFQSLSSSFFLLLPSPPPPFCLAFLFLFQKSLFIFLLLFPVCNLFPWMLYHCVLPAWSWPYPYRDSLPLLPFLHLLVTHQGLPSLFFFFLTYVYGGFFFVIFLWLWFVWSVLVVLACWFCWSFDDTWYFY